MVTSQVVPFTHSDDHLLFFWSEICHDMHGLVRNVKYMCCCFACFSLMDNHRIGSWSKPSRPIPGKQNYFFAPWEDMKKNADINSESTRNQRGKKKPEWCEGNHNVSYQINLQHCHTTSLAFQFLSFLLNIVKTLPSRLVQQTFDQLWFQHFFFSQLSCSLPRSLAFQKGKL